MELVEVNGVGVQPLEGGFAGPDNVVRGKIVSVGRSLSGRADAALGGDDGTAAQAFDAVEGFAKNFFGQAVTIDVGKVKMYVCGVTVYDRCHIGHARCYIAFDVVHRWLEHSGYDVNYAQNFTD
ncbi:MAG: hypothetical protein CMO63_01925, partial [Verrucomicrobiales bacterium]|nr:hypothetical protein [Verrucomicrobiales bacterium]